MLLSVFGIERQNTDPIDNDEHDDNNNNNNTGVRGSWSWLCWGIHSFSEYRTILLIAAFCFNLCAVACITVAAMAIQTSPKLKHIGWAASDPVRLSQSNLILECPSNLQDKGIDITVQVWLGLTGYYGECRGQMFRKHNKEQPQGATSSSSTTTHTRGSIHYHSDSFCSASTISNNQTIIDRDILGLCENPAATEDNNNDNNNDNDDDNDNDNDDGDTIHNNIINCELLTGENEHSSIANNNGGDEYYCSACKDNSRNCVGTLLSSAAFGAFPLVLTIRRLCSSKRERGLRLRTLFFSSLAILLGVHSFLKFHFECVKTGMPSAFSVLICSPLCNNGQPFLKSVSSTTQDFFLYTGGKLVIIAAILKISYFLLHLITPVASNTYNGYNAIPTTTTDASEEDGREQPSSER